MQCLCDIYTRNLIIREGYNLLAATHHPTLFYHQIISDNCESCGSTINWVYLSNMNTVFETRVIYILKYLPTLKFLTVTLLTPYLNSLVQISPQKGIVNVLFRKSS